MRKRRSLLPETRVHMDDGTACTDAMCDRWHKLPVGENIPETVPADSVAASYVDLTVAIVRIEDQLVALAQHQIALARTFDTHARLLRLIAAKLEASE